jgi:hypothetical protein
MPRKKSPDSAQDPALRLKTLALQDDPLVHEYRDIHYQLVIDSLQASGQRIASGERVVTVDDLTLLYGKHSFQVQRGRRCA